MPSSASSLLKVELQAAGENNNSWGSKANAVFSRLEEGIAATTSKTMAGSTITLDDTSYSANEARSMVLNLSGTTATIIIPNRSKLYFVKNGASGTATISTGTGTSVSIAAGDSELVYCNGSNVVSRLKIPSAAMGSITSVATVTSGTWNANVIGIAYGGTGLSTTPTNGKLLIGNGTNYTLANLTAGTGISITNAAGSITITATGGGGSMVYPGAGIAVSNGSAWTTSLTAPSGAIVGTSDSQTLSNKTLDANCSISDTGTIAATSPGMRGIAQNAQSGAYALALTDAGKHISITTGGITIPANASVAFPVGTAISIFNNSGSTQTVAITSDTLRLAGTTATGSRTLSVYGVCTVLKVASTTWVITGSVS